MIIRCLIRRRKCASKEVTNMKPGFPEIENLRRYSTKESMREL
jgi:hypothetical protein